MKSIIVFGDSLTFGIGDDEHKGGWIGRIKLEIESREGYWCIFNLGIPGGETINDVSKRIKRETLSRFKSKYEDDELFIILNIGVNDSKIVNNKSNTEPIEFQRNVRRLIKISTALTSKVMWVGPIPVIEKAVSKAFGSTLYKNIEIEKYQNSLKRICKHNKIHYVDLFSYYTNIVGLEKLYSRDGIHPNYKGYQDMAGKISTFIKNKNFFDFDCE